MIRRRLPYCIRSDVGTLVDDVRRYRDRFREHLRIAFFSRSTEVCTSQDGIKNDPHDSTGAVKAKDERLYGGLRSWDMLVSETSSQSKPSPTMSKAWHVWQLFMAGLPAVVLFWMSSSQEHQFIRTHRNDGNTKQSKEEIVHDDSLSQADQLRALVVDMERRLASLESKIHPSSSLSKSSSARHMDSSNSMMDQDQHVEDLNNNNKREATVDAHR